MMDTCCKPFSKEIKKDDREDLLEITKIVRPLIYKTVVEIVRSYKMQLLAQPADYIIPAIWGAKKGGELDATQKEINMQFIPVYKDLLKFLQCEELNESQKFAIGFLIRELFISKIAYMTDCLRNRFVHNVYQQEQDAHILSYMEVLGSA